MKIVVLADLIRPNGAGVMAVTQAQLLSQRHEVTLVAGALGPRSGSLPLAGLRIETFASSDKPFDASKSRENHRRFSWKARQWVVERLEALAPDVVLAHNVGRVFDQRSLAALSRRHPVAFVLHDEWFYTDSHYVLPSATGRRYSFEPYRDRTLRSHSFDHIWEVAPGAGRFLLLAPSQWILKRCREVYPAIPCVQLPNPVDDKAFTPLDPESARRAIGLDNAAKIVGFVGNTDDYRKGFDRLREMVEPSMVDLVLVIGGARSCVGRSAAASVRPGGVVDQYLRRSNSSMSSLSASFGDALAARGLQLSGVDRATIAKLYSACDLIIHPSRLDNLPTVPIEAGLAGVRCLASDVGGTAEAVAEADGLFDPEDPIGQQRRRVRSELSSAISEPSERREMRHARTAERFSIDTHMPRLESVLAMLGPEVR